MLRFFLTDVEGLPHLFQEKNGLVSQVGSSTGICPIFLTVIWQPHGQLLDNHLRGSLAHPKSITVFCQFLTQRSSGTS